MNTIPIIGRIMSIAGHAVSGLVLATFILLAFAFHARFQTDFANLGGASGVVASVRLMANGGFPFDRLQPFALTLGWCWFNLVAFAGTFYMSLLGIRWFWVIAIRHMR